MVEVDVQIIAATNRDLLQRVKTGEFREDLYYRLSVLNVHIPPLRERKEDLRDLIPQFIAECNVKSGKHVKTIPDMAWEQMEAYGWPGNIRELHNIIERCVLLADSENFPAQWLQFPNKKEVSSETVSKGMFIPLDGSLSLQDMEIIILQEALHRADNNVTAAARLLLATRETMRYRVQKYHLNTTKTDFVLPGGSKGAHLPPVPLCTFVLEPEVQVGADPINQASRINGHAHH